MIHRSRRLLVLVGASLAVLCGATVLLASVYHATRADRAQDHLARGEALARGDELVRAVEEYRTALSLERDSVEAERGLALALLSLGRLSEAESYLSDLLQRDPTDGPLNRGMARIHVARGRDAEARVAYQRSIYGQWPGDPLAGRIDTRFELLQYLARLDAREEVLAESLRLKAELPPGQTAAQRRVADLLLNAEAPELAIETLRAAAIAAPRDVELLAHLAEAEAATNRSRDARMTLRRALQIDPARRDLRERLAVMDRVVALDPGLPRLGLAARARRARQLLAAVFEQTRACGKELPSEMMAVRDEAALRLRRRARTDAEAADQELALAARLWSASPVCYGSTPEARALAHVLQRVEAPQAPQP